MKAKIIMIEINGESNIVKILEDTISYTTTYNIPGGKYQHFHLIDPNKTIIATTDNLHSCTKLSKQSTLLLVDYYNKNGKLPHEVEVENIQTNSQGEIDITI